MSQTLAEIRLFAGNFAPRGWAFCHGQLLPINTNQALFSLLGTIYGGDGRTTFALPDLRGRAPVSPGQGPGLSDYAEGQRRGSEDNFLDITNLPPHTHATSASVQAAPGDGTTGTADGNALAHEARGNTVPNIYNSNAPSVNMAAGAANVQLGNAGASQGINNMQPYLALNYIIALQGLFPSRN